MTVDLTRKTEAIDSCATHHPRPTSHDVRPTTHLPKRFSHPLRSEDGDADADADADEKAN